MKSIKFRSLVLFLWLMVTSASASESDTLFRTEYFTFHNHLWMNLHHFMYESASQEQKTKLLADGATYKRIGDSAALASLNPSEKRILEHGIAFYREAIIDQPLLRSGRVLKWLQEQSLEDQISDTSLSKPFTDVLNQIRPLYTKHFWKRHQAENLSLVQPYVDLIRKIEAPTIRKLERLSGSTWTDPVRVDLTTYGNWASAYSPLDENIVISSIDPAMHSTLFIEFVFHESSHLLFPRSSAFRKTLQATAKQMETTPPPQLWHAAMFYLSGITTENQLENEGVNHILIMEAKGVFEPYYASSAFRSTLERYYAEALSLEKMAHELLALVETE